MKTKFQYTKPKRGCIYYFLIIPIIILFISCKDVSTFKKVSSEPLNSLEITNQGAQILNIEGCEYVWVKNGYGAGLCHKGNCKNHEIKPYKVKTPLINQQ